MTETIISHTPDGETVFEIDGRESEFNRVSVLWESLSGRIFMQVHPLKGGFEAYEVPVEPDKVSWAITHPHIQAAEQPDRVVFIEAA